MKTSPTNPVAGDDNTPAPPDAKLTYRQRAAALLDKVPPDRLPYLVAIIHATVDAAHGLPTPEIAQELLAILKGPVGPDIIRKVNDYAVRHGYLDRELSEQYFADD